MAGGIYGPYEEPGWATSIPRPPDPSQKFLSGFVAASEVSRRRQQLENQLASFALRQQQMELTHGLREKQFQLQQDRMINTVQHQDEMLDLARDRLSDQNSRFYDALEVTKAKANNTALAKDAENRVMTQLSEEGLAPGDRRYTQRAIELFGNDPYTRYLPSSNYNAFWKRIFTDHNSKALDAARNYETFKKGFDFNVREIARGGALEGGIQRVLDYENLPDVETKSEWDLSWSGLHKTKPKKLTAPDPITGENTTFKNITVKDTVTGKQREERVSVLQLQALKDQWKQLQELQKKLAPTVTRPDLGVYPAPANNMKETAQRILADPNASAEARAKAELYLKNNP